MRAYVYETLLLLVKIIENSFLIELSSFLLKIYDLSFLERKFYYHEFEILVRKY